MFDFSSNYWWYLPLIIWETVWKGIALYKSAQSKDKYWFVAFLLLNTLGILPLIYLFFFNKDNFLAKDRLFAKKGKKKK